MLKVQEFEHRPEVPAAAVVGHEEGVERVAVARRVHARIEDAELAAVEIPAYSQEEVLLIGRVEEHLDPWCRDPHITSMCKQAMIEAPQPTNTS